MHTSFRDRLVREELEQGGYRGCLSIGFQGQHDHPGLLYDIVRAPGQVRLPGFRGI
jgi:hypothetical protein